MQPKYDNPLLLRRPTRLMLGDDGKELVEVTPPFNHGGSGSGIGAPMINVMLCNLQHSPPRIVEGYGFHCQGSLLQLLKRN